METDAQIRAWSDQQNAWQRDTIRRHGWAITAVFGGEEHPPFAYTVGLSGFGGHPELIITGLPPESCGRLLNDYGERVRAGERLQAGDFVFDAAAGLPLRLIEVTDSLQAEMLDANALYRVPGRRPIPALQVVWSDRSGHFPWEPGYCVPTWIQPLLGPWAG